MSGFRVSPVMAICALAAAACLSACSDRDSPPVDGRKVVDAPIESLDIVVRESFPPGYTLHVVSGLPSGCARFERAVVLERTGTNIAVSVTNTMPSDRNTICTAIYGYKETNLDLGQDFKSGQTYTVQVNDKTKTFVAQ